ncbi:MAG: acetate--CoA ligase [Aigarchaeota archaeon]|nr:acetate--CoA ligase [Aigarchaeota archaeon]
MTEAQKAKYPKPLREMLDRALQDTEGFWGEVAGKLHWFKPWNQVFEWRYPDFRWFAGGMTNISYNCLDYHVAQKGRGDKTSIIWESGETSETKIFTYSQLLDDVRKFAAALRSLGVGKGDRVTIYMPMGPEAVVGMLATTRIGAIHSVVFGGFGASALAERILDAGSKVLLTADVGYRRGKKVDLKGVADKALEAASHVQKVVVLKRASDEPSMKRGRDIYWEEALDAGKSESGDFVPMESNELAFILHTSGTTAKPKGTVQPHGSYQVYIYAMGRWVYDLRDSDVWWSTSDIGWIVGHSYVVYAPLLFGCSTVMYEGVPDYPAPDVWWRIVEKHHINKMWISPTGVRALMKYGDQYPMRHDLSSISLVVCAGEVLNPAAWEWLQKSVLKDRVPVIDHMWQTESSGPMIGNPVGIAMLPIKPGSAGIALPGIDADIVDDDGNSLPVGVKGNFVCRRPFPGLTPTLWRSHQRYVADYWERIPRCYYTGDAALRDEDGYIWFLGRMDEVIKISSHRIGTIEIESTLVGHPAVAEAAVVGKPDPMRGEVAAAFVVLKAGYKPSDELKTELRNLVRSSLGKIVVLSDIDFVSALPKTRSGKIMRRLIKAVITEQPLGDYSTIEDEGSIEEIRKAAEELIAGLKKRS